MMRQMMAVIEFVGTLGLVDPHSSRVDAANMAVLV